MKALKLSSLAQTLLNQLLSIQHICDPQMSALDLSDDPNVPAVKRLAYAEVYNYLSEG